MANSKEKAVISNKFITTLSASDTTIKTIRASLLAQEAKIEANTLVQNLERDMLVLEGKIASLTDLAPETTYSLKPGGENFDAAKWVKELHDTKMKVKLKEIALAEARGIVEEWFGDGTEK